MKTLFKSSPVGCVLALSFLLLVPVMALRDFTPANELRYLSIADEAIEQGHVFTFTNQGMPYADKPPLYFWIIMLCRMIFGEHSIFALSLFSIIPAFVIVTVMDRWLGMAVRRNVLPAGIYSPGSRAAMALMLMTSALFLGMSVFLRMDMLMCMFIVLALFTFYKMYIGEGSFKRDSYLLPVFIFLALFTKGPVGLLVPPVSIAVFLLAGGKWRETGRYLGWKTWGIITLLCAVWFAGVYLEGGKPYLENLLFHQTVDRAVNAFHHKEPFWYYLLTIWYVIAPYSIVLIPVLVASFFAGKGTGRRMTDEERLFNSIILSTLAMLSCFSSKLAIYLAPVFPFIVYLFPLVACRFSWNRFLAAGFALPAVLFAIAGLAVLACLPLMESIPFLQGLSQYSFARSFPVYMAAAVLAAGGLASLYTLVRTKSWQSPVSALAASMLIAVFSASFVLPEANDWIGYRNICREIAEMDVSGTQPVRTLFVNRPENMDVYLGRDIMDYGKDAPALLEESPSGGFIVVTTEKVAANPALALFLEGKNVSTCGPYGIYRL